jgi:hypothetical protein
LRSAHWNPSTPACCGVTVEQAWQRVQPASFVLHAVAPATTGGRWQSKHRIRAWGPLEIWKQA